MRHPPNLSLRWWIAFLLLGASTLNYIDRVSLSVLAPQIRQAFHLSNSDYALAVNSFLLVYTLAYPLAGALVDRIGAIRGFSLSVIVWSLASSLHGLARGLPSLCLYRSILAIGESGFYPSGIKVLSDNFSPRERSQPIALMILGLSLGATLAPPVVGFIALRWGWRSAFVITGLISLLLLPAWTLLFRIFGKSKLFPRFVSDRHNAPAEQGSINSWKQLKEKLKTYFMLRSLWVLILSRALGDSVWYFYIFWLPGYLVEVRHFDLKMLAQYGWIPFFSADLGGLMAGWVSSWLIAKGWSVNCSRKIVLVVAAFLLPAGILAYFAGNSISAVVLLSVATFGIMAYGTMLLTIPSDIFPGDSVGLVIGLSGASGSLAGAAFQQLVGNLADRGAMGPIFLLAGILHPLAACLVLLGIKKIQPLQVPR